MNTNPQIMAWMMDTYSMNVGSTSTGVVTGKPIEIGGSPGVSYFEWVQDFSSFFWTEDEINMRLDRILIDAFKRICETSEHHGIALRTAAFVVACTRVLQARKERGLYP